MVWTCRSDKEDSCLYNFSGETDLLENFQFEDLVNEKWVGVKCQPCSPFKLYSS